MLLRHVPLVCSRLPGVDSGFRNDDVEFLAIRMPVCFRQSCVDHGVGH